MAFFDGSHVNKPLTNISLQYKFEGAIADQVFPLVPVRKESDVYFIHDLSNLRLPETLRANGAEANEYEFSYSQASYNLEEHSLKGKVTDRDRANADLPLRPDKDLTENIEQIIQIRQEKKVVDLAFTVTSWSNSLSLGAAGAWSTTGTIPLADVLTMTSLILRDGHIRPNRAVIGETTLKVLKLNTSTTDMIKYVERSIITPDVLASLWDIDKIMVGSSSYITSLEGVATIATTFLWDDKCLIYYVPQSPQLKTPAAGYTLTIGQRRQVRKWRDEKIRGDWIEVNSLFETVIVATNAGALISDTEN